MPPPALTDDLIDEILLRFPPEEPELLVRAALACKRWFRLISSPRFRRRFRELHRAAPMLGFFCTNYWSSSSRFVPTSSFPLPHAIRRDWRAVDARHGRVLLNTAASWDEFWFGCSGDTLVVWNPITGGQHRLSKLPAHMYPRPYPYCCSWTAAVLCAAAEGSCDHLDCHRGPFLVVFVCASLREVFASVYSSETGSWSGPAPAQLRRGHVDVAAPNVLVGNAIHFVSSNNSGRSNRILKHVLGTQEISLIRLPRKPYRHIALMTTADGGLGFAGVHESKLYLWSRVPDNKGYAGWEQRQAIVLETIGTPPASLNIIYCLYGIAAILRADQQDQECYIVNLKSCQIRKIPEDRATCLIVPYMSFYTPALGAASAGYGPMEGSSNA
ncbi:unnamed protein product [Urochloa decumbens]|uniref:F-box domain-containing protein n=1 Tax=Urochloa decumbens TaxID=240449 RepID=A0ABC8YBQ7_9POAL